MKNLAYYKKNQQERKSRNRFQAAIDQAINKTCAPIIRASGERWAKLKSDLKLQRCNLDRSIMIQAAAKFLRYD